MVSLSPGFGGGGLGNILDSAVKTAVEHLASSPEGIDRSRVDFLYYDSDSPPFYDYYYNDHVYKDIDGPPVVPPTDELISPQPNNYSPPGWTKHFTPKPLQWTRENNQRFPSQNDDQKNAPPRPHLPPNNHIDRRVDRQSSLFSLSTITPFLPFLVILPVIFAASYYLIVQNGPTPVVKERREMKKMNFVKEVPNELVMNTLSNKDIDNSHMSEHKNYKPSRRESKMFTPPSIQNYKKSTVNN